MDRKSYLFILLLFFTSIKGWGQNHQFEDTTTEVFHINNYYPEILENIKVVKLGTQPEATSFIIWVADTVKPHFHQHHNETLYFIEGEGYFYVGAKKHHIQPGDFITIPKTIVHSFKTISSQPVKAISIQAPEFFGKDRIWVD